MSNIVPSERIAAGTRWRLICYLKVRHERSSMQVRVELLNNKRYPEAEGAPFYFEADRTALI